MRVCDDFRVIALGLPIPRYQGNPLDPPLRSRFQARDIGNIPFKVKIKMPVLFYNLPFSIGCLIFKTLCFTLTIFENIESSLCVFDFPP